MDVYSSYLCGIDPYLVGVGVAGGNRGNSLNDRGSMVGRGGVGNRGSDSLDDRGTISVRGVVGGGQRSVGVSRGRVGQRRSEVSGGDGGEEQGQNHLMDSELEKSRWD